MHAGQMETITASDLKARCLAILDRVQRTGGRKFTRNEMNER